MKKTMKKLMVLIMTMMMGMSLVACGGADKQPAIDAFNKTSTSFNEVANIINQIHRLMIRIWLIQWSTWPVCSMSINRS